jgi:hypothetical protein
MTYVKVLHTDVADDRWLTAGSDAFALHVAATVWRDRQFTDGRIPKPIARRGAPATIAPDETAAPIEALLEAGFWTDDGDAYVIVNYLEHAFPADQVKRTRDRWNQDKAPRRQHVIGDYSLCRDPKYCPAASTDVSTVESTSGGSHLDQTQPDQTRSDREVWVPHISPCAARERYIPDTEESEGDAVSRARAPAGACRGPRRAPGQPPRGRPRLPLW